ncbi:MAG: FAD binding domain-containing protein [Actinomycetota bacterium]|nr:FAD binding domain-containing protein [Actinomycetota bacterium]
MEIEWPSTLDEALDALRERPEATLLAGGTDLMVDVNFGRRRPEHVIALRRLEELAEWQDSWMGAGVTYTRMEQGPYPALAQAARTVGSPQIRNAGTLGGNLGTASPAGDALPFLAALDCEVELAQRAGRRRLRWDQFLVGPKQTARRPGELITGVGFPALVPARQAFGKVGVRNAMVIAIVSGCVVRAEDGATRVALGSVGPVPIRARRAEEMISGELRPSEAALQEFSHLVSEEVRPITDHRSTERYRRHAAGTLARRLLERCL